MAWPALAGLVATTLAVAAEAPTLVAPYLRARDEGRTGVVVGEALAEPVRASAGPTPRPDVSVMLLPMAIELDAELSRIRAGLRDSERAYLTAAARLRSARESYERDLAYAGGGELSRGEVTDAAGRFRFTDVPAGQWLLVAWRDVPRAVAGPRISKRDLGAFVGNTQIRGHAAVEYWRLAVDVRPGVTTELRLHDRNVWVTVIQEDTITPSSRAETVEGGMGSKRRQDTTR
ncbi:MAG TPA: hypothetical protein VJU81_05140 [Methylomirabilota bacterium]|nr:hypothetical protein [Methylomirabilota bacterium]